MANLMASTKMSTKMSTGASLLDGINSPWKRTQKVKETKTVFVEYSTPSTPNTLMGDQDEQRIHYDMCQQLGVELYKQGMVEFDIQHSAYNQTTTYQAKVTATPSDTKQVVYSDYVYVVDDMKFKHQMVKEALKKTFPEYWF